MDLGVFKLGIFDGHFDRENMGTHGFSWFFTMIDLWISGEIYVLYERFSTKKCNNCNLHTA